MDALLRYSLYKIAYTLLIFEIFLMISCCLAIIITKFVTKRSQNRREDIQSQIGQIIEHHLFSGESLDTLEIPGDLCQFRNLIETLEKYDHLFSDQRWRDIKEQIVSKYLLPQVHAYASSFFWFKRQLAARCLLLCPKFASEKLLTQLLDDKRYLVRVTAAVCITETHFKDLFYKMIQKMSQETTLSQFPYRDALIQASAEKHAWMESLLSKETDKKVIAICLDVLSTRYVSNLLPKIKPFVNDSDPTCRTLAIRALGNIPNHEAIELLIARLDDSDWKIRAEAIQSLQKLYAIDAIPKLEQLLSDPVWWVRLQSALTLKAFGKNGIEVLVSQNKEKEPIAYEISQYTLALP